MTESLTNLTSKKVPYKFDAECKEAFEAIKAELTSAPVLTLPDASAPYKIKIISDACDTGIGAVLLQNDRPIAYESRKLYDAERGYSVTERELLAVVYARAQIARNAKVAMLRRRRRRYTCYGSLPQHLLANATDTFAAPSQMV